MSEKKAKRYGRRSIYSGYCFKVVVDDVQWPNGQRLKRDLIIHPGISVIVPQIDEKHLILIRQYRYGAGYGLWEIPAGTIDGKESPLNCAKREIEEEIGYKAKKWKKLAACFASPGFNTEVINCFLASDLIKTKTRLEADEILEPEVFTLNEVHRMIRTGKIEDAKSLVALFYFFELRKGK